MESGWYDTTSSYDIASYYNLENLNKLKKNTVPERREAPGPLRPDINSNPTGQKIATSIVPLVTLF